jgi:hypothetical protein
MVGLVWFTVFNATFNNISGISWQTVLLVEKTRVPRKNHQPALISTIGNNKENHKPDTKRK